MSRNFYIADTHFGHANIVKYDENGIGHPTFPDIDAHDEVLKDNWNAVVGPDDTVYIIGDFSWMSRTQTQNLLCKLRGNKVLVMGNHDKQWMRDIPEDVPATKLIKVCDYLETNDNGEKVVLSHYPHAAWNRQYHGAYHLYGHIHNNIKENENMAMLGELYKDSIDFSEYRAVNAGCMLHGYMPCTLEELKAAHGLGNGWSIG